MDNSYLIPANSKKSMLILGYFNTVDLIIFGCGLAILRNLEINKNDHIIIKILKKTCKFRNYVYNEAIS